MRYEVRKIKIIVKVQNLFKTKERKMSVRSYRGKKHDKAIMTHKIIIK